MNKINNKGFSIVELLAVIVIIGILASIGIIAATKYLNNASEKSYNTMMQSMQSATVNYREGRMPLSDNGCMITSEKLQEANLLETMRDPDISNDETGDDVYCRGDIYVKMKTGTSNQLNTYLYKVVLTCPSGHEDTKYFPESASAESWDDVSGNC